MINSLKHTKNRC